MLTWAIAWMYSKTGRRTDKDALAAAMLCDVLIVLGIVSAVVLAR